jgi:hypothetical protein
MNRITFAVAISAVVLVATAPDARADKAAAPTTPRLKVAIVPGIAVNLDSSRVDALGQDMAEALIQELDVDVVGGLDVRRELPADLPADCVTTPSCVTSVATRTGAQQLLFVVMVDSGAGGSIQIDTTWVDATTGKSAQRPAIDVLDASSAKARFVTVAHQLLPDAPSRTKPVTNSSNPSNLIGLIGVGDRVRPRHFTTASATLGIVGGVGLLTGLGFGIATKSSYDSCDSNPAACTPSKRDSIRTTAAVADVSWIAGLAAAVVGTVLYVRSGGETIVVTPTAGGAAATLVGRF